jgi:hypothetical protein
MSQKIGNSTRQRYVLDSTALYNTRQSSLTKNYSGGFLHRSEDLIAPHHGSEDPKAKILQARRS